MAATLWGEVSATQVLPMGVSPLVQISRERSYLLPTYWYHSKGNWLHYNFAAELLYNETLHQTFRLLLSKLSKRRQIWVIYPHFEEVRGGVEPWLMARWKARVEFLLSVTELFSLALTVEEVQDKMCQNSLPSGGGGSVWARFQGKGSTPASILIWLERQFIALQLCRWQFLYNKTLQQTSRPLLTKLVWKTTNLGIWFPFSGS